MIETAMFYLLKKFFLLKLLTNMTYETFNINFVYEYKILNVLKYSYSLLFIIS